MNILLIEPYFTGSHASWAEGYARVSRHNVEILSLEGRNWRWRMRSGAVTLAKRFMERPYAPELILASDMLDLTTFLSLTRPVTATTPTALYFHENQFTYPATPRERGAKKGRDPQYGFINYTAALTADHCFFNSRFHMDSFLGSLAEHLSAMPDYNEPGSVALISEKSSVLYLGMDLKRLKERAAVAPPSSKVSPLILWNHRWEYDKNAAEFFDALYALEEKGIDFEVALLGESFGRVPEEFEAARERLGARVVHFGYAENLDTYASWLESADLLPVTSHHDFFGCSVVEAIYMGCVPLLPDRLAYPEHIPEELRKTCLYDGFNDLVEKLSCAITNAATPRDERLSAFVARYDWDELGPVYDSAMERVAGVKLST
jgi:glycosyltransferase involved in cell wall biosynthesis